MGYLEQRDFCVECGANFGIKERSRFQNTCTDCLPLLRPAGLEATCEDCGRIIQIGEKFHLQWAVLCQPCVKKINRSREAHYVCDCVGRS